MRASGYDSIRTGCVVSYPYLWAREAAAGEQSGRKNRPVAVAVRLPRPDGDVLVLLAITSQPPVGTRTAVEIPPIEKRRAGLDADKRLWIVTDEYNEDVIGRSLYLEAREPIGQFGKAFLMPILRALIAQRRSISAVNRR